ncbi:Putative E3 ubiquitin-protein ligase UBR7 [Geodia barretti]|uniref:E3 ubiquitin-protein ligase UBR7 n=1 Tax=Geodia barretti TaxID=519541 RepID=A0AA35RJU5_GEOBA|nr:Putative E3 ubiquitin-protein ligase UBR7 [Geodia barretti]
MSAVEREDEDTVVSLQDVLEENRQLEETANAVLGPSDDSSCTYSKGYVDRQALYSCATCSRASGDEKLAGICLACSLHCHEGHDLYELYTKRRFRCDCGNSMFPSTSPCTLCAEKTPLNPRNKYNHNFSGLYCTCNRPYPDPDDEVEDEMIQCCVCEDWFHSRHLGGEGPPEGYEEMVCGGCMAAHRFLESYRLAPVVTVMSEQGEEGEVEKERKGVEEEKRGAEEKGDVGEDGLNVSTTGEGAVAGGSCDRSHDQSCELERRRNRSRAVGVSGARGGTGFFASSWRSQLCRCTPCMSLYREADCLYLLEEADTISSYEARAGSLPSSHESAMTAFSSTLDRVHQVEAIHQYNDMKTELVDFLKGFVREGKV